MASEIRVNSIKNRSGLGTITVSDSGAVFSGVTTFAQIKTTSGEVTVGTGASVFSPATNVLALGTNNTEKVRITSTGSVGIGTDNPTQKLDVNGVIRAVNGTAPEIIVSDNFVNKRFIFGYTQSPVGHNLGSKILADGLNIGYYTRLDQNGSHIFYTNNGGSDAERLRITSTGRVGIGTDNPTRNVHISGTTTNILRLENTNANVAGIELKGSTGQSSIFHNNDDLRFLPGGTEQLRITNTGNVGIGTDNPGNKLHLGGTVGLGIRIQDYTSGQDGYLTIESGVNLQSNISGSGYHTWHSGGGEKLRLTSDGKLGIGTDTPSAKLEVGNGDLLVDGSIRTKNFTQGGTTSEGTHLLKETVANASFEGNPLSHPFLMNDLANHIARGGSYAISGLTSTHPGIANVFSTQSFWTASNSQFSGSTFTITLTNLQHGLSYGAYAGIVFGSSSFAPASLKIETSTDNGANWTTRLDHTGRQSTYFTSFSSGGTPTNAIRYTIGQGEAGSVRIQSLWAFNYASTGMHHYFLPRDGGQLYGNLSLPSGNGIDFSATGGPDSGTGSSELLDDYEEGTYSPAWQHATNVNYTAQNGQYIKVGRLVRVSGEFSFTTYTSFPNGWDQITLPFNGTKLNSSGSISSDWWAVVAGGTGQAAGTLNFGPLGNPGSNVNLAFTNIFATGNNSLGNAVLGSIFTSSSTTKTIRFHITYTSTS